MAGEVTQKQNAAPVNAGFFIDIKNKCSESGIPFFFKQWGGQNKKKSGSDLNGESFKEMPLLRSV
jgi:protein gp37